ncbi:MAG: hypothetical protein ACYTG6_04585 [Planctomycetota bacterium]|jgi:hypothetical protein
MSAHPDRGESTIVVHGLLVCRNAELAEEGRLNLQEVLEVVAVDALPGDAGPLTFVAFLRRLPPGKGEGAFTIHPAGSRDHVTARLPLDVDVPEGSGERQVALQVRVPSIPVTRGGWYDVVFEWNGRPLATNRFAIGLLPKKGG